MKLAVAALVIAVSGCASQKPPPPPPDVRVVGQSSLAPKVAATCIATKWSSNSGGQPVYVQYIWANDTAFDVYVPTQMPPSGSAAVVRTSGTGSTVGFRGTDTTNLVPGIVGQCQ